MFFGVKFMNLKKKKKISLLQQYRESCLNYLAS